MHRIALMIGLCGALACGGQAITEDGPVYGYARLSGRLVRSTGAPASGVTLFVACGWPAPTGFARSFAVTDTAGAFAADVNTPAGFPVPADGRLACRISAPAGGPPYASVLALVPFAPEASTRQTTVISLAEGVTAP